MKRKCSVAIFLLCLQLVFPSYKVSAQDPITLIIKEAITKTIKAIDLKVQRLQNETIRLQNAQKAVENTMAKLKLQEITDWVEKQRLLYADYFQELRKVKNVISYYHKVSEIMQLEIDMTKNYQHAIAAIQLDQQFSLDERTHIASLYRCVVQESLKSLNALSLLITSYATQMSDGKRMELIDAITSDVQDNYHDLRKLITQTRQLSLSRARASKEITTIKDLYEIR